ncbi:hypothetical protein Hanom_Chr05g00440611 [Helianthus anomalus]
MGQKGKEHVGFLSQHEDPQTMRRRRLVLQADIEEEDSQKEQQHDKEEENVVDPKPKWDFGPLDEQPEQWQPSLFHDQMNRLNDRPATFICEKEVREVDFGPFNVINRFKTLGWEVAL